MDWITTTIGIFCFRAVESNPFIAGIAGTNLLAFAVIKLSATLLAGLMFYQGERLLLRTPDKTSLYFKCTRITLRSTCIAATVFLFFAVVNNLVVVFSAI